MRFSKLSCRFYPCTHTRPICLYLKFSEVFIWCPSQVLVSSFLPLCSFSSFRHIYECKSWIDVRLISEPSGKWWHCLKQEQARCTVMETLWLSDGRAAILWPIPVFWSHRHRKHCFHAAHFFSSISIFKNREIRQTFSLVVAWSPSQIPMLFLNDIYCRPGWQRCYGGLFYLGSSNLSKPRMGEQGRHTWG